MSDILGFVLEAARGRRWRRRRRRRRWTKRWRKVVRWVVRRGRWATVRGRGRVVSFIDL